MDTRPQVDVRLLVVVKAIRHVCRRIARREDAFRVLRSWWWSQPYHQQILETVHKLEEQGNHEVAVVTAHMAYEILTERSIALRFESRGVSFLEEPIAELLPSYSLANRKGQRLYVALSGDAIEAQPFWSRSQRWSAFATRPCIKVGA